MFDTEKVPIVLGNVFKIPLYYSLQIMRSYSVQYIWVSFLHTNL